MSTGRTRNYVTLLYPESVDVDNSLHQLRELHIAYACSPCHDKDVNEETGEIKKAHYHLVIVFSSVKTIDQARAVTESIGGVGCEAVLSIRGQLRYLCHLDDIDKASYNLQDVQYYGLDFLAMIETPADRYEVISDMMDYVDEYQVISFAGLLRYARRENPMWFRCLCDSSAFIMKEYIKSRAWELSAE